ncbi:hypothetical protein CHLRE_07g354075v5 [Chlamydomonas reinhardtii]|uniref:Uncharacterized protein n=1 Tax=Chlamydomonas reinhardtii TaxID=3055 RepID=A0A2K3DLI3_CHLRE|nr:uncharacterized protein CHLRE_07g354075v5 [Chlamydomonas reinhardtii]PNW81394.1 hypothetical protein CHLRE_07g354075v5 [Chlamydomonas reinhardtii]
MSRSTAVMARPAATLVSTSVTVGSTIPAAATHLAHEGVRAAGCTGGAASAGHLASAADELGKETGSGVQHNVPLAGAKRVVHYLPWAPGRSS